jgi:hypothetical protein
LQQFRRPQDATPLVDTRAAAPLLQITSIGLATVAERVQDDLSTENVIPQAVDSPPNSPLTFSRRKTHELFYLVPAGAVLRIDLKDRQ